MNDWTFDRPRIDAAARALGLELPARPRLWSTERRVWGEYCGVGSGAAHCLRIRRDLKPEEASFVVWHELGHAVQCERLAHEAGKAITWAQYEHQRRWLREMSELGITEAMLEDGTFDANVYNRSPMEEEANAIAQQAHRTKLVIVRGGARDRYRIPAADLAAA